MKNFGKTIRLRRENLGKSMRDLAEILNVSVVYVSDIELGRRSPPIGEKLDKIADFLALSRDEVHALASCERKYIEIPVEKTNSPLTKVALALAERQFLSENEARQILEILKN